MGVLTMKWVNVECNYPHFCMDTPFGSYFVWINQRGCFASNNFGTDRFKESFSSIDEAKKYCETDFNERINKVVCL